MKLLPTLTLFFLWGIAFKAPAQDFWFKRYMVKDGLSNDNVQCVTVDSLGFLWVGTANGLNRWDGNNFQIFTHDPSDSGSIGGNLIQGFFIDREKRMWVGTNEGISLYHSAARRFSNYAPDTAALSLIGINFRAFAEDGTGRLWIGTKNDLLIFDPGTGHWRSSGWAEFADKVTPSGGNRQRVVVLDLLAKGKDELWVWTTYGLFSVHTVTGKFQYYPYKAGLYDYFGDHLKYADKHGNLWISRFGAGLLCYDPGKNQWSDYHIPPKVSIWDNVSCIKQYYGDTLILATLDNLLFFNAGVRNFLSSVKVFPGPAEHETKCNDILRLGENCWLATNKGLLKMVPRVPLFHFNQLTADSTVARVFRSTRTGAVVFGTANGCGIKKGDAKPIMLKVAGGPKLTGEHLYYLELPGSGGSCFNGEEGFYLLDESTVKVSSITFPKLRNTGNTLDVRNMVTDRTGKIWLRTLDQGVYSYDPIKRQLALETDLPDGAVKETSFLYYDSLMHSLWISEEFNGVYVYDIAQHHLRHYLLNAPPSQRGAAIIGITGDGRGHVWMNNLISGFIAYDDRTHSFTRYTSYDGLISDNVIWSCMDGKGNLWISTDLGLSRMDTGRRTFTNYYTAEGYPSTADFGGFISRDQEGNLYMPYRNGYYTWKGDNFTGTTAGGSLYLQKLQVSGRDVPGDSLYHFAPSENNLQFRLGWLSLEGNDPPAIEYRLNNGPWFSAGVQSYISFARLQAGWYDLWARPKNRPGVPLHLAFSIARPLWLQRWFLILLTLVFLSAIIWGVRRRIAYLRKESLLKQQVMESEMATLRSQMNPHFVFNTLNSINSYIIDNKTREASDYLTDFSRLMRIILEHSRIRQVSLEEELRTVKLYLELESKRLEEGFDYRIEVQEDLDITAVQVPPLIIQPFVENAIWHGLRHRRSSGHIDIKIEVRNGRLRIAVIDNGIGREAAGRLKGDWKQRSFGTAATIRRIKLADPGSEVLIEDLRNEAGESSGTGVNIFLYLSK